MPHTAAFRHEVMLYDSAEAFVDEAAPFVRDAVAAGEPVMVAIAAEKIALLRARLGDDADGVVFADMAELGANPARIIPAWQEFVDANAASGRPMRGIGEPIWADRSPTELVECQCHEALLNVAFADASDFHLLCPYDTVQLDRDVIAEAEASHPFVDGAESDSYRGDHAVPQFVAPLPEPPADAGIHPIALDSLADLRLVIAAEGERAGLSRQRTHDVVLAVHEIATNSIRHGGGRGVLRVWREADTLICDIRDSGRIARQPLVGRVRPALGQAGGWGLWLANQLCDLVQLRELPDGSVVRLHQHLETGH
jgi:anti-sigma regulatory factor (Ser/Thr protein kinase)